MIDKRLFTEIKGDKGFFRHLGLDGFLSFAFSLAVAVLVGRSAAAVFPNAAAGNGHTAAFAGVVPMLVILLCMVLMRSVKTWYFSRYYRNAAVGIKNRILSRYVEHLLTRGPNLRQSATTGASSALVGEAAEHITPYYHEYLPALFTLAISLPLILASVAYFDLISFVIMLVTGPVLPFFLMLIGRESEKAGRARFRSLSRLGGRLLDYMSGAKTLKLFGKTAEARQKISEAGNGFRKVTMQVLRISFLSAFTLELAATISTAIIAVTLGSRLLYGKLDYQSCLIVLLLTPDYFMAIRRFGAKFHVAQNAKTAAELLLTTEMTPTVTGDKSFPAGRVDVEITGLSFSYDEQTPAVRGVNALLKSGEMTAFVGQSGSGKSTTAHILLRLLEPDSGTVTIGGVPLCELKPESLRRNVAYVPQRPYIFKGTIRYNILLANPNATTAMLEDAVREACLGPLIDNLPDGLETELADMGANLSAGERQRIAIARALLKDAPLVIIDEAVSAQDKANELLLTRAIERLARDKTVMVIAHRLETVRSAHRIYMMDRGTVIEDGQHEELMALGGQYHDLVCSWEDT